MSDPKDVAKEAFVLKGVKRGSGADFDATIIEGVDEQGASRSLIVKDDTKISMGGKSTSVVEMLNGLNGRPAKVEVTGNFVRSLRFS